MKTKCPECNSKTYMSYDKNDPLNTRICVNEFCTTILFIAK